MPDERLIKLGLMIKEYRKANKLSQSKFAYKCGTTSTFICHIEKYAKTQDHEKYKINPQIVTFMKLAKGLNMNLDRLFAEIGWSKKFDRTKSLLDEFKSTIP